MNKISAVIITLNEENNIARCIKSLNGVADEIIVVDSGSTDSTKTVSEECGARFIHHEWAGYAEQKNYAETLASYDWILSIDADEALSEGLRKELSDLKNAGFDDSSVYSVPRLNNFGGVWIRHCGWYPDRKIRIWHRDVCRWDGVVHEDLSFLKSVSKVRLSGDLLHYTNNDTGHFINRQIKYAVLAAEKAYARGRRCGIGAVCFKPLWTFISSYFLRGGFLDGAAGYMVCRISAFYTMVKYARLRELGKRHK